MQASERAAFTPPVLTLDEVGPLLKRPKAPSHFSESSVANLYLFRSTYGFRRSARWAGFLEGAGRTGTPLLVPLEPADRIDWLALDVDAMTRAGFALYPLSCDQARAIVEGPGPRRLSSFTDRDQADYLYLRTALVEQVGHKRKKVRQYVRGLCRTYDVGVEPIVGANLPAARDCLQRWADERADASTADVDECREGLDLAAHGHLDGLAFVIDGRTEAIALVDDSIADTTVVLFLKASRRHRGLADYGLRAIADRYPQKTFVNTCQDLGIPGLRRKKLTLGPAQLVHKVGVYDAATCVLGGRALRHA